MAQTWLQYDVAPGSPDEALLAQHFECLLCLGSTVAPVRVVHRAGVVDCGLAVCHNCHVRWAQSVNNKPPWCCPRCRRPCRRPVAGTPPDAMLARQLAGIPAQCGGCGRRGPMGVMLRTHALCPARSVARLAATHDWSRGGPVAACHLCDTPDDNDDASLACSPIVCRWAATVLRLLEQLGAVPDGDGAIVSDYIATGLIRPIAGDPDAWARRTGASRYLRLPAFSSLLLAHPDIVLPLWAREARGLSWFELERIMERLIDAGLKHVASSQRPSADAIATVIRTMFDATVLAPNNNNKAPLPPSFFNSFAGCLFVLNRVIPNAFWPPLGADLAAARDGDAASWSPIDIRNATALLDAARPATIPTLLVALTRPDALAAAVRGGLGLTASLVRAAIAHRHDALALAAATAYHRSAATVDNKSRDAALLIAARLALGPDPEDVLASLAGNTGTINRVAAALWEWDPSDNADQALRRLADRCIYPLVRQGAAAVCSACLAAQDGVCAACEILPVPLLWPAAAAAMPLDVQIAGVRTILGGCRLLNTATTCGAYGLPGYVAWCAWLILYLRLTAPPGPPPALGCAAWSSGAMLLSRVPSNALLWWCGEALIPDKHWRGDFAAACWRRWVGVILALHVGSAITVSCSYERLLRWLCTELRGDDILKIDHHLRHTTVLAIISVAGKIISDAQLRLDFTGLVRTVG